MDPTQTPNPTPTPTPNPAPAPDEKQKELDRVLQENQNLRKQTKDLETKVSQFSTELDGLKKQGLKTNGDWQKLAETYEAERNELKGKLEKSHQAFVDTIRVGKVKEELLKLNLRPEAIEDVEALDLSAVPVEIVNGTFVTKGADLFAQNLKKSKGYMFKDGVPPVINPGTPGGAGDAVTLDSAKKAYQEAFKERAKKPNEFRIANEVYQKAIRESRKAKK